MCRLTTNSMEMSKLIAMDKRKHLKQLIVRKKLFRAFFFSRGVFRILHHLYNLKNVKNTHAGVILLVKLQALLKASLLHGCFSRFLNCTDGTKSRKVSHICLAGF